MKDESEIQKRFDKPYHFLSKATGNPSAILKEVFRNFHLDEFEVDINLWEELALSNANSAYEEGCAREDLIDFVHELLKLIEAFYVINEKNKQKGKRKQKNKISVNASKMDSFINDPCLKSTEEGIKPYSVIKQFCNNFSKLYVQAEILDMLEAVISYEGEKKFYKHNIVLFYQHLDSLVELAYGLPKKLKRQ